MQEHLKKEGTIKLKKNSDALVYANNRFITFSNKGKYPLENLAEKSTRNAKLNFDPLFGEYIKSAVLITGQSQWNIKTNKSNGDGWNEISKWKMVVGAPPTLKKKVAGVLPTLKKKVVGVRPVLKKKVAGDYRS
ncbi:MAG: hypothetical protein IPO72_18720 [Saprospiraceae bacterium]|nr:hypothetical protein [Candidatus Vicinibacter affinis]